MMDMKNKGAIPIHEYRRIVQDLFTPNPAIYWVDFLFHVVLGWSAFVLAVAEPIFSPWQLIFYPVAVFALYRAAIFTHELAHLKKNSFKVFRIVWNLVFGFPLMLPSFTYHGVHNDHHARDVYGTNADGEYLPFAVQRPYKIILYLLLIFILPILFAVRFILLTPFCFVSGKIRRFTWERLSSLTIDLSYRRAQPPDRVGTLWRLQEFMTFLYGAGTLALIGMRLLPAKVLLTWYLVAVMVFLLNSLRTLAAHRYRNPGDYAMDVSEQFLDSVDVPGTPFLTALWAPVGLRYHATHHLFPAMPYHALGEAHRRLAETLPDNSVYLQATRKSLADALRRLWHDARMRPALAPEKVGKLSTPGSG